MRHLFALFLIFITACGSVLHGPSPQPKSLQNAVQAYLGDGNIDTAEALLLKTIDDEPNSPDAKYMLADLLDRTGRPAIALSHYLEVLKSARLTGNNDDVAVAAAMSLVAIRDRVEGFKAKVSSFIKEVTLRPGSLPPAAVYQLRNLWFSFALKEGDTSEIKARRIALGCITKWNTAGPFGPRVWETFDAGVAPLRVSSLNTPWPDKLDLGQGLGVSKVITRNEDNCLIKTFDPRFVDPGVGWAKTLLTLTQNETVVFRLNTGSSARVYAGEVELFSKDNRLESPPSINWFAAKLPAGTTQISVQLADVDSPPVFSLVAITATNVELTQTSLRTPMHGTALLARLKAAIWWDDSAQAQSLIKLIRQRYGTNSPVIKSFAAEILRTNPSIAPDIARERAVAEQKQALVREPRLFQARLNIARFEALEGRDAEAIKIIERGLTFCPNEPSLLLRLVSLNAGLGRLRETQSALEKLDVLLPSSCDAAAWRLALARRNYRFDLTRHFAAKLSKCDARSSDAAKGLGRSQQYQKQAALLRQRYALMPQDIETLRDLATNAAERGDTNDLIAYLRAILDLTPTDATTIGALADALIAQGDSTLALAEIEKARSTLPGPQPLLDDLLATIKNEVPFAQYRLDGFAIIKEYQARKEDYETSAVWVLDRAVHIIKEDGSRTEIVHNIIHLKTDEAIEKHGELSIPNEAYLLRSRTIKADGRILEPESILEKSSLSLPGLAPGDFIETEYAIYSESSPVYPGGFDTGRFYFADFFTAFHRSELIIEYPKTMTVQLDPRGDCPAPTKSTQRNSTILTWSVHGRLPVNREPLSPNPTEYLPSIRVTANASFDHMCARIKDMLADLKRPAPSTKLALAQIRESDGPPTARSIYHWTMKNIENSSDLFQQAGHIIGQRSGHRARAFCALLTAAGINSQIAMISSTKDDATKSSIPSLNLLRNTAVLVDGKIWVSLDNDGAPYGYLPPSLRNRPGVFIDNCEKIFTDKGSVPVDRQDIHIEIFLANNGDATATVTETLTGEPAVNLRSNLRAVPISKRDQFFQKNHLASHIPGALLDKLSIQMLKSQDNPLVLTYSFSLPGMAVPSKDKFTVSLPFHTELSRQIGSLPTRKTTLVLAQNVERQVTFSIQFPSKNIVTPLLLGQIKSQWGTFEKTFKSKNNKLTVFTKMRFAADRIQPKNYDDLMEFARETDQMSKVQITYSK